MIHDISRLQKISIWTSNDLDNYTFLMEFHDLETLINNGKHDSVSEIVNHFKSEAKRLMNLNLYSGYRLQFLFEGGAVCYSSHDIFRTKKTDFKKNEVSSTDLLNQRRLVDTLTSAEKKILWLRAKGFTKRQILSECKIKLNTYYFHRKNIYQKMNFKTTEDLIIWANKYSSLEFE